MKKILLLLCMLFAVAAFSQRAITIQELPSKTTPFPFAFSKYTYITLRDSATVYILDTTFAAGSTMNTVFVSGKYHKWGKFTESDPQWVGDSASYYTIVDVDRIIDTTRSDLNDSLDRITDSIAAHNLRILNAVTDVFVTSPLAISGTKTKTVSIPPASPTVNGYLPTTISNIIAADSALWGYVDFNGFVPGQTNIRFDSSTHVFTLSPISPATTWRYVRAGRVFTITGSKTVDLDDVSLADGSVYYILIDDNLGTLTATTIPWTLLDFKIPVAVINWNSTLHPVHWLSDERHTVRITRRQHAKEHFTEGTKLVSGGILSGYSQPSGTTNAHNTFSISQVTIADEDLFHTLPELSDPTGSDGAYQVFYHSGASTWTWDTTDMPYKFTAGGYIDFDNGTTTTEGANSFFYNSYLLYTNKSGVARFAIVLGRSAFATASLAYSENPSSFSWDGFPIAESVIAYQMTWEAKNSHSQKGKCRLTRAPQRINSSITTSISPVTTVVANAPLIGQGTLGSPLTIDTANATTNGFLLGTDWVTFNSKEPAIASGTAGQYWIGNKTWQTREWNRSGSTISPYAASDELQIGPWLKTGDTDGSYRIGKDSSVLMFQEKVSGSWRTIASMFYSGAGGSLGSSLLHNALSGLQGGTTDQYYHLTAAEHAAYASNTHVPTTVVPTRGLLINGQQVDISVASATLTGALSAYDWNRFNTAYGWGSHTGLYEPQISKSTGYLKWNGSAWTFANETYSLSSHNHLGVYDAAGTAASVMTSHNSTYNHTDIAHGETAFTWGNHAGLYPLKADSNKTSAGNYVTRKYLSDYYALLSHNHSGTYEPALSAGTAGQYLIGTKAWQTREWTRSGSTISPYAASDELQIGPWLKTGDTDGSYRIGKDSSVLMFQEKVSGSWKTIASMFYSGVGGSLGSSLQHNALSGLQGGTTDQYYHLTAAEHAAYGSNTHVPATVVTTRGLSISGQQVDIQAASTNTTGALLSSDWNIFNNKRSLSNHDSLSTLDEKDYSSLTNRPWTKVGSTVIPYDSTNQVQFGTWLKTGEANGSYRIGKDSSVLMFQEKVSGQWKTIASMFYSGPGGSLGSSLLHNALSGLQGGTTNEYYHLTAQQFAYLGDGSGNNNHDPVTIGTANGLSISGQQLSLGQASTSTSGALSSTDWNTFNNKVGMTYPVAGIPLSTGSAWGTSITNNSANWNKAYDSTSTPGWVSKYAFNAAGDMLLGTGNNTYSRIPIGSNGQIWTSDGTTAAWQTPAAGHNSVTLGASATTAGLSLNNQELGFQAASGSQNGYLTSTNWNTFNNKVSFPGFGTTSVTAAYGDHLHTGTYDNYQGWDITVNSGSALRVGSLGALNLESGSGIQVTKTNSTITFSKTDTNHWADNGLTLFNRNYKNVYASDWLNGFAPWTWSCPGGGSGNYAVTYDGKSGALLWSCGSGYGTVSYNLAGTYYKATVMYHPAGSSRTVAIKNNSGTVTYATATSSANSWQTLSYEGTMNDGFMVYASSGMYVADFRLYTNEGGKVTLTGPVSLSGLSATTAATKVISYNATGGVLGYQDYNYANWDNAYGWGNHAGLYPLKADSNKTSAGNYITSKFFHDSTFWTDNGSVVSNKNTTYALQYNGTFQSSMNGWTNASTGDYLTYYGQSLEGYDSALLINLGVPIIKKDDIIAGSPTKVTFMYRTNSAYGSVYLKDYSGNITYKTESCPGGWKEFTYVGTTDNGLMIGHTPGTGFWITNIRIYTSEPGNVNVKGDLIVGNTSTTTTITDNSVTSENFRITPEGGYAVRMIAAEALELGDVVIMGSADNTVSKTTTEAYWVPVGVVYANAATSTTVWVVVSGIATVKFFECDADRGEIAYTAGNGLSMPYCGTPQNKVLDPYSWNAPTIGTYIESKTTPANSLIKITVRPMPNIYGIP